jgi:hypothetical protein
MIISVINSLIFSHKHRCGADAVGKYVTFGISVIFHGDFKHNGLQKKVGNLSLYLRTWVSNPSGLFSL